MRKEKSEEYLIRKMTLASTEKQVVGFIVQ